MTSLRLDPQQLLRTSMALERRVAERFPESGLRKIAGEVVQLTRVTTDQATELSKPIWWLRALLLSLVLVGAGLFVEVGTFLSFTNLSQDVAGSVQSIEALINTIVLGVIGVTALVGLEARIKRKRVGLHLHSLRSVIHVIDMHQLTKDPDALTATYQPTVHSPVRNFTAAELVRYLDYCAELLAITGKLAALYAQAFNDEQVAEAVSDIEELGTDLSRKVGQKMMVVETRLTATNTTPHRPRHRVRHDDGA
jgi:hypothetical protein